MDIVYTAPRKNTMVVSKNKSVLDAIRGREEIVLPVGDGSRRIGWTLMPISEYARARYGKQTTESILW